MSIRSQLEKKIASAEADIESSKAELTRKEAFLMGLKEALKMLPRDDSGLEPMLRPGTDLARCRDTLLAAKRSLHIDEILKAIGKEVNKTNRASVSGSITAYARKGVIFEKTAPATFGLVDYAKKDQSVIYKNGNGNA